jgi:hypothetical protein
MIANIIRNANKYLAAGDPYYSAVSLMLSMDGTNGSTTFTDSSSNALTVTNVGSPTTSTTQVKFGTAAAAVGGSNYLTLPNTASLYDFGLGDFTIEFWFYYSSSQTGQIQIFARSANQSGSLSPIFIEKKSGANYIGLSWTSDGTNWVLNARSGTVAMTPNAWNHVAIVRRSGTFYSYINGTQDWSDSTSSTSAIQAGGDVLAIGRWPKYANSPGTYYIDDLRISRFARYVSNFTPPTAALPTTASSTVADPYYNYTSLLLHMDGANGSTTFTDSGPNALTVTPVGSTQISTAQAKYGGASGYFDGSGDYLSLSASTHALGSGDFTVEFWMYPNLTYSGTFAGIMDSRSSGNGAGLIYFGYTTVSNEIGWYENTGYLVKATVTQNAWNHVAVVRSASSIKIYINGVISQSASNSTNLAVAFKRIAATWDNYAFEGYMDDLRITKYARYTANFTPPAAALPDIYNPNTSLPVSGAALWLDASQQNTIFTDAGTTPVTTSGQSIYQWNDLSGNNRHAIQATSGNRPTWVPPASGQNGLGAISFNGSSSFFDTSMSLNGLSSFSIFLVAKSATSGGWQSALRQQSGFQGFFVMPWTSNGGAVSPRIILGYDGGTTTPNTVALTNGAFNLISFIRNSGVSNVANVNGVLSSTRSANTASLSESVNLSIGRYPQPVAEYFSGSIAEIVIFNRALSPSETSSVESYLKTKWGTP